MLEESPSSRFMIVTRRCPECTKLSYWRTSKFQELIRSLKYSPKDGFSGLVLCDACNLISAHTSTIAPPRMYDTDNSLQGSLYENLFAVGLACDEKKCESRAIVLAPKMEHYKTEDVIGESRYWHFSSEMLCDNGHPIHHPVQIVWILQVFPR